MKKLNIFQNLLYRLGAVFLLAGLLLWIPRLWFAPYVYLAGAVLFAVMQTLQSYEGRALVIRRLRRQQLLGAFLLIVSGGMMIAGLYHVHFCSRNEWLIVLVIAAVFEIYSAFRIPVELSKHKEDVQGSRD